MLRIFRRNVNVIVANPVNSISLCKVFYESIFTSFTNYGNCRLIYDGLIMNSREKHLIDLANEIRFKSVELQKKASILLESLQYMHNENEQHEAIRNILIWGKESIILGDQADRIIFHMIERSKIDKEVPVVK